MHARELRKTNSLHISKHHDDIEIGIYLNLRHYYIDEISMAKLHQKTTVGQIGVAWKI